VILERSPPGVQDTRDTREIGADAARLFGERFKGRRRRLEQGLRGETLRGAAEGPQGCRAGAGEENMRFWELGGPVVREPRRGVMVLTRRAVALAAGGGTAVLSAAAWARRAAVAVMATWARWEGAYGLAV
jgi:hypothetical protein